MNDNAHSFVSSLFFFSSLSPWLRLKHDRQTDVQQAMSILRICIKADYRLGSLYLSWSLSISRTLTRTEWKECMILFKSSRSHIDHFLVYKFWNFIKLSACEMSFIIIKSKLLLWSLNVFKSYKYFLIFCLINMSFNYLYWMYS